MYYIIYKITNQINNKIYIGCHKTKDINDDYMGSGKYLKHAKEKYGIENFTKDILHSFDNSEDMFKMESTLVNDDFVLREDTYNLKHGGEGGFEYINSNGLCPGHTTEHSHKMSKRRNEIYSKEIQYTWRQRGGLAAARTRKTNPELWKNSTAKGRKHTDETKQKISIAASKNQLGDGNSQYGTMWIYSLEEKRSMKINKNDEIPKGWSKGRKMKFNT